MGYPHTPETDAKRRASINAQAERRRFYIRLNPKPKRPYTGKDGRWRWEYAVWPMLFKTREAAEEHLRTCNVFRGGGYGSASVEVTVLPKKEPAHGQA